MNWKFALGVVSLFAIVVAPYVAFDTKWDSPAEWLEDWTAWIGSVVAIVVAARVFWVGGDYLVALKKRDCGTGQR